MAQVGSLFASLTLQSAAFNSGMQRARRTAAQTQGALDKNFSNMESRGKRAFAAIAAAGAAFSLGAMLKSIANTNTEYQRLMGQLQTATGSFGAAAGQMKMLQQIAATTPFALNQVTEAFIKLRNMGLDSSERSLISYGNTASSMGKDIMMMIEAVADAATGEFERLKEFGIKASKEKDKVALTFKGITTEIGNSAEAIEGYLLRLGETTFAGAMQRQSETLGGALSNLGDTVDQLAVRFGEAGFAPALEAAVRDLTGATSSVEDFAETLGWLTGTAIGYTIQGITALIENIDLLVNILGVVAVAKIGMFAAAIGRQALVALTAFRASMMQAGIAATLMGGQITMGAARSAAAMQLLGRAGAGALAFFGGPIGLAITGVSVALGLMGVQSLKSAAELSMLDNQIAEGTRRREEAEKIARALRTETGTLSAAEQKALTDTANLTGQVHLLATAYGRAALEAKRAAIEIAKTNALESRGALMKARREREMSALESRGGAGGGIVGLGLSMLGARPTASPEAIARERVAQRNLNFADRELRRVRGEDATSAEFGVTEPKTAPTGGGSAGGGSGSRGTTADPYAAIKDGHEFVQRQRQIQLDILRSQDQLAHDYQERSTLASQILDLEIAQATADLDLQLATKEITKAQYDTLKPLLDSKHAIEKRAWTENQAYEQAQEALQFVQDDLRRAEEFAQMDASMATTARERRAAELRLLALRKEQERLALEAITADGSRASEPEKQDAMARKAELDRTYGREAQAIRSQTMGPLESFIASIPNTAEQLNEAFEFVAANGMKSLEDGIVDAITGAKSLADAFTGVADSIIKDLMRIMVQKYIVGAISGALGGLLGGLGGGSVGSGISSAASGFSGLSSGGSNWMFDGFRAAGGPVSEGKTYWVGEKGPELFTAPKSGKIVPNHRAGGGSATSIHVDARGASNPAEIEAAAARVFMRGAPMLIEQATAHTLRKANRPKMNV